jgi:hypothetical protein
MSQTMHVGDVSATLDGYLFKFSVRPPHSSSGLSLERRVNLPFKGLSMAMHPPTNVVAVIEGAGPASYVTPKRFPNLCRATLTNSTLV